MLSCNNSHSRVQIFSCGNSHSKFQMLLHDNLCDNSIHLGGSFECVFTLISILKYFY
jgi:hypothetical protein